jgi:hypothetical protein
VKEDGEDPLVAAVRRLVTIGSESIFSMLMMHGVEFDADKVTGTYPKGKDGRDIAPKAFLERARNLSARMTSFLAERNEKRAGQGLVSVVHQVHRPARPPAVRHSLVDELVILYLTMWCRFGGCG